jgi:hypothetical protein
MRVQEKNHDIYVRPDSSENIDDEEKTITDFFVALGQISKMVPATIENSMVSQ